MSIVVSDARPAAAPLPAAVAAASPGFPATTGSTDDRDLEGTPFDAALLACLVGQADTQAVAADMLPADAARGDADDSAAPAATDDTLAAPLQGMPAMLTALLQPAQVAAAAQSPAMPEAAAARAGATSASASAAPASWPAAGDVGSNPAIAMALATGQGTSSPVQAAMRSEPAPVAAAPSEAMQSLATPDGAAAKTRATSVGASAGPASWPAAGDAGSNPAIAMALAAGQGAWRPLPAAARGEPAPVAAEPADTAQSAASSVSGMSASVMPAGEGARALQADGADRSSVPASVLSVGLADTGTPRSPDAPLRLPNGDASQWRQPLAQALGERLQFASERGIDSAVIRLEPPRMGSIEIAIRHQDGALQVNLSATHNEVLRQLQDISDSLRHGLGQRHAGEVTVQVADTASSRPGQGDGERQRQRQAQSEQNPGRALGDDEADGGTASFRLARNEE